MEKEIKVLKMASSPQASCLSDPNFAVICAFLERFAKSCGITYPTFTDLQEMLENVEQVPQELVDLHIKLLRKARKTVFLEKWEKALIKFCHTYSSQDGWEIERFGYKKSKLEVKLRALKMLLEGQFDLNNKFKASINTLESDELRSKPLGRDRNGRIYWLQFDPVSNIRVYREDLDEESWTLVAQDRSSLIQLLQELSGDEHLLDLNLLNADAISLEVDKPLTDTGQSNHASFTAGIESNTNNTNSSVENNSLEAKKFTENKENLEEDASKNTDNISIMLCENKSGVVDKINQKCEKNNLIQLKTVEIKDNYVFDSNNGTEKPINKVIPYENIEDDVLVNEVIEEPVMYIVGDGSGKDCMTGNPGKEQSEEDGQKVALENPETNEQKTEEVKETFNVNVEKLKPPPKLWSIDAICGVNSSKKINQCVNSSNKTENLDIKTKQKNFSSFSIDSVLEKKSLISFDSTSVSKFSFHSQSDSIHFNKDTIKNTLDEKPTKSIKSMEIDVNDAPNIYDSCHVSSAEGGKTEENNVECNEQKVDQNKEKCDIFPCVSLSENKSDVADSDVSENSKNFTEVLHEEKKNSNEFKTEVKNDILANINETLQKTESDYEKSVENIKRNEGTKKSELEKTYEITDNDSKNIKVSNEISEKNLPTSSVLTSEDIFQNDSKKIKESLLQGKETADNVYKNLYAFDASHEKSPSNELKTKECLTNVMKTERAEKVERECNFETRGANFDGITLREGIATNEHVFKSITSNAKKIQEVENTASCTRFCSQNSETLQKDSQLTVPIPRVIVDSSEKSNPAEIPAEDRTVIFSNIVKELETSSTKYDDDVSNKINSKFRDEMHNTKKEPKLEETIGLENCEEESKNMELKEPVTKPENFEFAIDKIKTTSGFEKRESELDQGSKTQNESLGVTKNQEQIVLEDNSNLNYEEQRDSNELLENKKRKQKVPSQRILSRNRKASKEENKAEEKLCETDKTKTKEKSDIKETIDDEQKFNAGNCELKNKKSEETSTEEDHVEIRNSENKESGDLETQIENEKESAKDSPKAKNGEEEITRKGKKIFKRRRKRKNRAAAVEKEDGSIKKAKKLVKDGSEDVDEKIKENNSSKKKGRPKKDETSTRSSGRQIPAREIKLLGIENTDTVLPSIRQSRRIAQIKMKEEAERRRVEALQLESFKSKKKTPKSNKKKSRKNVDSDSYDEKDGNDAYDSDDPKLKGNKDKKSRKKKKKDKLVFNELNPWLSSSGSSTADEEEEDIEDEPHEDEELVFKSDHEFSPESDIEDPDYKPVKRARTAKVEESKDEAGKYDDTSCENCGKNDHPEWILLCDKCDKGWHASCVRPALMVVPEGDWFCPPCEHMALLDKLKNSLIQYDRCQKQRENEELRKKRLAFVGISLDNVLPPTRKSLSKNGDKSKEDEKGGNEIDSESTSGTESEPSESGSETEDEPVYQLRERRSNLTSYRYNEYDELIKSALQDEIEAVKGAGNAGKGKDISNIVNAERHKKNSGEYEESRENNKIRTAEHSLTETIDSALEKGDANSAVNFKRKEKSQTDGELDYEIDTEGDNEDEEEEKLGEDISSVVPKNDSKKKKSKSMKITSLDFTSEEEDRNSDSDFKGASSEEESDYTLPSESESSDDYRKKKSGDGPLRRSTRARVSRYDRDFINDDSDDSHKRKKIRRDWDSSESSDSDRSWGRKKRRGNKSSSRNLQKKYYNKGKKKKQRKRSLDSEREGSITPKKPRNRKIKYGGLESLDEDSVLTRRTRGKKINYQEITGSDSEDEIRNRKAKCSRIIESDDDFIAENEKDEDLQDGESEVDSVVDEEEYEKKSDDRDYLKIRKNSSGKKKNILEKIKKKKWVIPDPDDFSENDLMEDEQLDKVAEELEDLDEEEEEILGNILESGDVPIHELKAAVKRAKEEKILRNEVETKTIELEENESIKIAPNSFLPASGHSESVGGGKFPKIGKVKITPSRAELASKLTGVPAQTALTAAGKPKNFVQNSVRACSPEKVTESPDSIHLKEKSIDPDNSESGLLFKSLQDDLKNSGSVHVNIPPNRSFKSDTSLQIPGPFITYSVEAGSGSSLNTMGTLMSSQSQAAPGSSIRGFGMLPTSVNSGHSVPEFNALQGLVSPPRIPLYTSAIPTTVTGLSNLDSQSPRKKPGPKPGTKLKRKLDDSSPQSENSNGAAEPSESILSAQQADELSQTKNIQDFSPKKKGRGRGKKQLLAEAQAQGSTLGKQDPTLSTVQTSSQFSSQSLTSEGGSVITRILNSPQGPQSTQAYLGSDSNQFPAPPRNRPTFAPSITSHFQSSRSLPALRLRSPVSGGTMFHTSHPLDPSPSGGGAINIPITSSGVAKSTPPPLNFNRTSSLAIIPPRFTSESATRPVFPSRNSPPRPEFSFTNYYGSFSQSGSSVASSEGSSFQSSTFQESFGEEVQMSGGASSKHFEDEISGEFGGLASYFASQREDDLDT